MAEHTSGSKKLAYFSLLAVLIFSLLFNSQAASFATAQSASPAASPETPPILRPQDPSSLDSAMGIAPLSADGAAAVTNLDERLTNPRNFIAADMGNWSASHITNSVNIAAVDGLNSTYFDNCYGWELFHPQHVVRLRNYNGHAYFVIANDKPDGGYISVVRSYPGALDPTQDLVSNNPNGFSAFYLWQDVFDAANPAGNWNHPGKMEVIGDVLVVAAQNWVYSMNVGVTTVCKSHPGTSDDALLFYDIRNPEKPVYWGKMTASQLGVPANELASVDIVRTPNDEYYMFTGGASVYPLYKASFISPDIKNWTKTTTGPSGGQHGMNFSSYQMYTTPPSPTSPAKGIERNMYADILDTCDCKTRWVFSFSFVENAYDPVTPVFNSSAFPNIYADLVRPPLTDYPPNTWWDSSSLYVTRKGATIFYSMKENIQGGGVILQTFVQADINNNATPHPDQVVTNTNDSGPGSLRRAIGYGGKITFALTADAPVIQLTSGPLEIYVYDVDIDASSMPQPLIIKGDGTNRVFDIQSGVKVTLNTLTIANGRTPEILGVGAGIRNYGNLTIRNSTIRDNTARNSGGGIFNFGTLVVENSTIANNITQEFSGAGITNIFSGTLTLRHSTVASNIALKPWAGVGVDTYSGKATIENSIIANNTWFIYPSDIAGTYDTKGKNIILNRTSGLFHSGIPPIAEDPLLNPLGDYGGRTQTMSLRSHSPAIEGGYPLLTTPPFDQRGVPRPIGTHADLGAFEATISQTFPGLEQANIHPLPVLTWSEVPGATFNVYLDEGAGLNLIGTTTGTSMPVLPALATSFQVAWRVDTLLPGPTYPGQIPYNITYTGELQYFTTRGPLVVTTLVDENDPQLGQGTGDSLRETIAQAIPDETITFAPALSGQTITLAGTELFITRGLTIDASALLRGIRIDAQNLSRVLNVSGSGAVVLKSLTLSGGNASSPAFGGGILNNGAALTIINSSVTANHSTLTGGGIYNASGSLTLLDSDVSHNVSTQGGSGLDVNGTVQITNSTITGNTVTAGGVLSYGGGMNIGSLTTVTITGSTFSTNSASFGGALYVNGNGSLTLNGTQIVDNSAVQSGGAIYFQGTGTAAITLVGVSVSRNQAGISGGGLYLKGGTAHLENSTEISENNAVSSGGGIYHENGGSLAISDTVLARNSAVNGGGVYQDGTVAGTFSIQFSTLSKNSATAKGGGLFITGGAGLVENSTLTGNSSPANLGAAIASQGSAVLTLRHITLVDSIGVGVVTTAPALLTLDNVILANNFNIQNSPADLEGNYTAAGANLVRVQTSGTRLAGPAPLTVDPQLVAYGAPSDLLEPLAGSPVIDAGVVTPNTPAADQIHAARVFGPRPDLGAIESYLSANASLEWFTTNAGPLDPIFRPLITSYTANVESNVVSAAVRPSQADPASTVQVRINNGAFSTVLWREASAALPLNPGDNVIEMTVTASNLVTTKTYTLTVHRGAPSINNAFLAALSASAGALSPVFSPATAAYNLTVANATASTTVTASSADPAATMAVRANFGAFVPLSSGTASAALALTVGDNPIDIQVTAQDGTTTATTTLIVTREAPAASNANLNALSTNAGGLTPVFNRGLTFYNIAVTGAVTSATVTASPVQASATLAVRVNNGAFSPLASGAASAPLTLNAGANLIEVKVTASDAVTVKSYTLIITRTVSATEWASQRRLAPGAVSDNASFRPSISSDGRYVAFSSRATNLVDNDTNFREDVFVYDRTLQIVERVSVDDAGVEGDHDSLHPSISADGRYVAFESRASNLVPNDTNGQIDASFGQDIFVYDRTTKTIERVSLTDTGTQSNQVSERPSLSGDGRYVAFASSANNLVTGYANGQVNVYIVDRTLHTIVGITVPLGSFVANRQSLNPAFSQDGSSVAFEFAVDKSIDSTPGFIYRDIYVYARASGVVTRISGTTDAVDADGNQSSSPSISSDGRYVAFQSNLKNIDFYDANNVVDVFVYDQTTGITTLASVDGTGSVQGPLDAINPSLSSDGHFVAFQSYSSNYVTPATNGNSHIYMKNLATGAVSVLSASSTFAEADGDSFFPSVSANGVSVAFESQAANLAISDTNGLTDIYISATDALASGPLSGSPVSLASQSTTSLLAAPLAPSSMADLSSLAMSSSGFAPGFSSGILSYAASVPNATPTLSVRAIAADSAATIAVRVNSGAFSSLASNANSDILALNVGSNTIELKVTAQNGLTVKSYNLTITRAPNSNANLADLTLAADMQLELSPGFTQGTLNYTVSVANGISTSQVIPTTAQANATVQVNGVVVASGIASSAISLPAGSTPIAIVVTAQDGTTVKSYNITVTRRASDPSANTAPAALPQTSNVLAGFTHAFTLEGFDAESSPLAYTVVTQPLHGVLAGTAPDLTYTPTAGYTGSDTFTFKVNDGLLDSLPATITLVVKANQVPIAAADSLLAYQGGAAAVNVLLNDFDLDYDHLTVSIATPPAHGTLTVQMTGVILYTPNAGYLGADSFIYSIADGKGGTATATVTVNTVAGIFTYMPLILSR